MITLMPSSLDGSTIHLAANTLEENYDAARHSLYQQSPLTLSPLIQNANNTLASKGQPSTDSSKLAKLIENAEATYRNQEARLGIVQPGHVSLIEQFNLHLERQEAHALIDEVLKQLRQTGLKSVLEANEQDPSSSPSKLKNGSKVRRHLSLVN